LLALKNEAVAPLCAVYFIPNPTICTAYLKIWYIGDVLAITTVIVTIFKKYSAASTDGSHYGALSLAAA
jgi:hypothetical protein